MFDIENKHYFQKLGEMRCQADTSEFTIIRLEWKRQHQDTAASGLTSPLANISIRT